MANPTGAERQQYIVQIMTTEHFTLQTARGNTVAETNGRVGAYLSTVATTLVALAFIGQISHLGPVFSLQWYDSGQISCGAAVSSDTNLTAVLGLGVNVTTSNAFAGYYNIPNVSGALTPTALRQRRPRRYPRSAARWRSRRRSPSRRRRGRTSDRGHAARSWLASSTRTAPTRRRRSCAPGLVVVADQRPAHQPQGGGRRGHVVQRAIAARQGWQPRPHQAPHHRHRPPQGL